VIGDLSPFHLIVLASRLLRRLRGGCGLAAATRRAFPTQVDGDEGPGLSSAAGADPLGGGAGRGGEGAPSTRGRVPSSGSKSVILDSLEDEYWLSG